MSITVRLQVDFLLLLEQTILRLSLVVNVLLIYYFSVFIQVGPTNLKCAP